MKLNFKPVLDNENISKFKEILEDIKQHEKLYYSLGLTCRIYRDSITCYGRESINLFITFLLLFEVKFYV